MAYYVRQQNVKEEWLCGGQENDYKEFFQILNRFLRPGKEKLEFLEILKILSYCVFFVTPYLHVFK